MSAPEQRGSTGAVVATVFTGIGTVGIVVGGQFAAWIVEQLSVTEGRTPWAWLWPVTAVAQALLVGVPALALALVPRSPAVRAAGRAWTLGAVALAVLGSLRTVPVLQQELYLAVLAGAAAVMAAVVRRRATRDAAAPGGVSFAVAGGVACLLPWAWLGGLGGPLETLLAAAAALAVGWLAAAMLPAEFWAPYATAGRARLVTLGGLVAGVALTELGAGVGASGVQLSMLLVLPSLAFAAAALHLWGVRWPLYALAAFGPLAFVDPEETWLILNWSDVDNGWWATLAAVLTLIIGLLVGVAGLVALVTGRPIGRTPLRRGVAAATAGAVLGTTILGYAFAGQPGLHGDRLFVVLREQADLSGLDQLTPRDERVRATYRRLVEHADRTQAPLRAELDRLRLAYRPYYLVNGIEVHGGAAVRAWLSRRADVDRVLLSPRLRPLPARAPALLPPAEAPEGPLWNVQLVQADQVWRTGVTGRGIVVGSSDSGVDGAHPTLAPGFRGGDDSWYDPWNHTRAPTDHIGHGTHTAGTAVGRAPDGTVPSTTAPDGVAPRNSNPIGVAPGAQWVGCVNLDRGTANPAFYLDCLQFMLAPFTEGGDPFRDGRPERAPHVLTNSWGCPELEGCDLSSLRPAAAALAAAGIFMVVAAGNTGPACGSVDDPPAPYPDVLTVGAVDRQSRVASFSSRGPSPLGPTKPDVVAPGVDVLSAFPGGRYAALPGTSMAAPHVAGVVALMWSANPALIGDVARTRQILVDTAEPTLPTFGEGGDGDCEGSANVSGSGVVDAAAAVTAARAVTPAAPGR
jgi:subtilisin family serine protease